MDTANTLDVTDRLPDGLWNVDPGRSEIGFAVNVGRLLTVRGIFGIYQGSLHVRPSGATGELTIEAASLDTRNRRRDRHLRSSDFFDVERHPLIVFAAEDVTMRQGALAVTGQLAIGAARLGLEIPVSVEQGLDGMLRLEGETTVSRAAAGMAWNWLGVIANDARLYARLALEPTS